MKFKKSPISLALLLGGASAIISLLSSVGCQIYQPKALDPGTTAISFGKRRLDDPQLRDAIISSGHWSRGRGWPPSPWRLRELQGAALYHHPEIAVAKARGATMRAGIETAGTRPNPTLSIGPEYGNKAGAGVSPWVIGFSLDVPLETANKRGERTAQAIAASNSAALSAADTAWTVSSGVRAALLELEICIRRLDLLEEQRGNDADLVSMVSERVKAGEAPKTDLGVYQTQQGRDLLDLADGRSKLDAARVKLATALGVPAISIRNTAVSFGALDHFPAAPAESSLRKSALIQRSDILGALEDYAASDAALRLEIAKQTPDIHLNPGYTFDQGQSKWALGIGFTLPIDRNAGPIREAAAKRDESAAVFERLQIGIRGELDQALAAYNAERQRLREVENLVTSQNQQFEDAERLSKAGEGDRLTANAARSLVLQAKLARIDALGQAQQSLGRLEDSARISFDEN
ncbi:TolC family protein [Luteolibacter yonseiensis]|uniref:TolC family protein n=1 Tax=Luteolibacter yonseiensis TaxID=1144680 RepID=A0A934VB80_9BACT|nr:TolC family protein [Luteolibacter yonseiensis]MBK1816983.1 TolC family protein [Luteolibacter yonseiensis]